ncbi:MAG: hypothetical protein IKU01_01565 [Bacteroidales bacterium]|nr:hypothetical protein [Bacteroidales bacterium]
MSVGLYDEDFFKYHQTIPNLELMKISTYYKRKGEIVVLSPSIAPDRYSQFFLRKDYYDGTFPEELKEYSNIQYGGLSFSYNKYYALANEIEACDADFSIYLPYRHLFEEELKNNALAYVTLKNAAHLRLSIDEKTVSPYFINQAKRAGSRNVLFLHDYDLSNVEGARAAVEEGLGYLNFENRKTRLATKYPIRCKNLEQFDSWRKIQLSSYGNFRITSLLDDEDFYTLAKYAKEIRGLHIIYSPYPVSSTANHFSEEELLKIFRQVIFCCNNHVKILLSVSDNFLLTQESVDLIRLFSSYNNFYQNYDQTDGLYRYCKLLKTENITGFQDVMTKEKAKKSFLYVVENYPNLFKEFYERNKVELVGGNFI